MRRVMVQITVWEHQDFLWPASDRDAALRLPGIVSTKNKELKRALRLSRDPISLRQGSGASFSGLPVLPAS